ncbi:MAG TPA: hypothetical protein VNM48_15645 [Chloroflexota bacterium]|nr:hypothetical protein [Chloroflexota bacterium]
MTTTTTATQAIRPLATRSRAELERAVIEAARWFHKNRSSAIRFVRLDEAIADLDEWEKLRAEAAELAEAVV